MGQDPPVDAIAATAIVRAITGRPCSPATIRYWAWRDWIHVVGIRGRANLYDPAEIYEHVTGTPVGYTELTSG